MVYRIIIFVLLVTAVWAGDAWFTATVEPQRAALLAVAAVNGGEQETANLRGHESARQMLPIVPWLLCGGALALCFGGPVVRAIRKVHDHVS